MDIIEITLWLVFSPNRFTVPPPSSAARKHRDGSLSRERNLATFQPSTPSSNKPNMMNLSNPTRTGLLAILVLTILSFTFVDELTYDQDTDLKELKHVNTQINFSAGKLVLGTAEGTVAGFRSVYTNADWKADVNLDAKNESFTIKQEGEHLDSGKKSKNEWDIRLPRNLPTDLKLNLGAGDGEIDLSSSRIETLDVNGGAGGMDLNLANTSLSVLKVNMGAGGLKVDLSGNHTRSLSADISNGVGGVKLFLPESIGVRVKVNGIFGLDRGDFRKKDGYWVNDLYGKTKVSLDIRVKSGIGGVVLRGR